MTNLAIDIGGTHTRIATVTPPEVRPVARFPTASEYQSQITTIVEAVRSAGLTPRAAGVSFGGRIDRGGRSISVSINLRGYEDRPLPDDLGEALSCPVRVAHDAVCGLLGEHAHGSLRPYDRCAYVTLSTGTGAAFMLGTSVTTSEAPHQLTPGTEVCSCGQRGCLQTLTGGRLLEQRLGRPLAEIDDRAFWLEYAESLALGLGNFALAAGIDAIALGGSVILSRPEIWPPLRDSLARRFTYLPPTVLAAELGEVAPLVGAAVLLGTDESAILH